LQVVFWRIAQWLFCRWTDCDATMFNRSYWSWYQQKNSCNMLIWWRFLKLSKLRKFRLKQIVVESNE